MKINLIACINQVNALGKNNVLLYHISSDLANFKRLTLGKVIIMGKNTYESLPKKPLPNRTTIIICNEEDYTPSAETNDDVFIVDSIEAALNTAETLNVEEVFVVGGASIYKQFMEQDLVDKMFITLVNDETEGDVEFPQIDSTKWVIRYLSDAMKAASKGKLTYNFIIYERIK